MARPTRIVLYHYVACEQSARVRRRLRELDLAFEGQELSPGDRSVVRFRFGTTRVPVLRDGATTCTEVESILRHLEFTYAGRSVRPSGSTHVVAPAAAQAAGSGSATAAVLSRA